MFDFYLHSNVDLQWCERRHCSCFTIALHCLKYLFASFVKDALRFHFFICIFTLFPFFHNGELYFCIITVQYWPQKVVEKGKLSVSFFGEWTKDLYQIFGCISTFQTEKVFNELQQLDWCLIVIWILGSPDWLEGQERSMS